MHTSLLYNCAGFRLRPLQLSDAESMARNANNHSIWRNLRDRFPHPYSLQDGENFLRSQVNIQPVVSYCIDVEAECAGVIGIIPFEDVYRRSAEIGYWLGEPFWGRGFMTQAVSVLSNYIFSTTDIIRLHAGIFEWNRGSMRVLEKAGFQQDGIARKAVFKDGQLINEHRYSLLKDEWNTP